MATPHAFELGHVQTTPGDRISFMRLPRAIATLTIEPPTTVTAESLNTALADPNANRNFRQMRTGDTRDTKVEPVVVDESQRTVWRITSSEQRSGESDQLLQTVEVIKAIVTAHAESRDLEPVVAQARAELFG